MGSNIRNRRLHPAHSKKDDHGPSHHHGSDNTGSKSKGVKAMNLNSSPRKTDNDISIHPAPAGANDNFQLGPPRHIGIQSPTLSHTTASIPPMMGISAQTAYSTVGQNNGNIQDYLNTGVERYSIGESDDGLGALNSTRSHGSSGSDDKGRNETSVPNPFLSSPAPPPWQPIHQKESVPPNVPFGSMSQANMGKPFPVGNISWQGSFTQQMKQISEYYMHSDQVNSDDVVDPPLLEELGIDIDDIIRHIKCVVLFKSCNNGELQYGDFTGPLVILILFGLCMLISCNLNLSLVYAIEVLGNTFMYVLFNLLSQDIYIDLAKIFIILGYSLLPICLAPVIWIFSRFAKPVALILVYLCVIWSTSTATRLLTVELNMATRKYLVLYPTFIYYMFLAHAAMA
ncbi:Golgi membrane yip1domain containing protein, putative [Babesia ovis]|uniref:Golgi membrane yip1domain containing protein, putative n=1 Tax=Babesia ovis TaxID=5869 RepID=A0A9W5TB64_BABOV|nr:Golgi membrane yip1domain containing protein, putative [Babesia ovis]